MSICICEWITNILLKCHSVWFTAYSSANIHIYQIDMRHVFWILCTEIVCGLSHGDAFSGLRLSNRVKSISWIVMNSRSWSTWPSLTCSYTNWLRMVVSRIQDACQLIWIHSNSNMMAITMWDEGYGGRFSECVSILGINCFPNINNSYYYYRQ